MRTEPFHQEIDECAHAGRHVGSADEDRVNQFDVSGIELFQEWHEPAVCDLVGNAEGAHSRDADACGGELAQRLAIVGFNVALDRQYLVPAILAERPVGSARRKLKLRQL